MSSNTDSKNQLTGGLSTKDAIHRLYKDIEDYLDDLELLLKDIQSWKYILRQAYSSKSVYSTFRWTSVVFLLISTVTYLFASKYGHFTSSVPLTIESIILILVLIMNTSIIYWNTRSRHLEMFNKARLLAAKIKECYNSEEIIQQWMSGNFYPQLNTPTSPCITLQWTYRDGRLVNLPTTLLVSGDVVLLNPGRQVPANCRRIEKVIKKEKTLSDFNFDAVKGDQLNDDLYNPYEYIFYGNDSMKDCTLMRGDTFVPKVDNVPEIFNVPRLRKAVKPCMFLVVETPYISDMKIALSNYSNRRSATAFEKELRLIFVRYLELILVPFICTLVFIFSIIHYCYIEFTGTHFDTGPATIVLIFLRPIMAILPLLPLALPVLWLVLNVYGLIKIYTSYEIVSENETAFKTISNSRTSSKSNFRKSNYYSSSEDIDNNVLNWPNSAEQGNIKQKEFFLEEMDPEKLNFAAYNQRMTLRRIFTEFYRFLSNANGILWRTANLLHVLGSITALSCADKKGIISWPNPTADKVFFLTAPGENRRKSHHSNQTPMDESSFDENADKEYLAQGEVDKRNSVLSCSTRAECVQLDITHDRHIAYGLQFDDVNWNRYMSNLKPLGLAILLNTCNQATQEEFVQFSDHIACESLHNDVAVPVVNKRCLCELARQIGFKENAIRGYEYRYQVALFRHIRADLIQKGKLAKSLNFPRLKMPFPNMTCAVIKDVFSNTSQLFSQGTGDLILDACAEYWNGESLVVLNDHERKKILDFYQRSSLTSYCCAFSYLPLINESGGIQNPSSSVSNYLNDYYIELPPDSSHLFPSQRSLDASLRGLAIDSHYFYTTSHNQNESYSNSKSIGRHLSSDSLRKLDSSNSGDTNELCGDKPNQANKLSENKKERTKSFNSDSQNLEQTMKKVVNEVFIGMATLQYQACSDFVRLIELLEAACIRFVHFSKENELRSRVFSEKMGLESGWNCHISLLNDIEPTNSNEDLLNENCDIKKSKSDLNDNSTQVKFNKSSYRNSLSSLSSTGSLLENKDNDTDNEDWDERIESFPGKEENVKFHRRRKHNSFSVSSDRSESTASNLRYNRPREFRSSSKISGHSNVQRNMSPSPSRLTTASTMTEHSAPIGFDMSNRAKLPKGIDNIRPHLENVDNVPLLVSLFTDCTSEATKEMIKIMQEYEEVVCVIGSMANDSNIAIFLQADASIGIEPMYPHYCITEPVCPSDYLPSLDLPPNFISPTDLANQLISLPCSLTMPRQNSIIFYQLIMNSRDYMMRMRNIFQFYLSSCLSLSLAQMITSLLFLPPLLSPGIVIWLSLIVIPLLSVSLMGTQRDQNVMNVATGKKLHLNKETIVYFFIGYIIKFIPSIIISVILFAIIIGMSCGQTNVGRATLGPCWMFSDVKANGDIKTDLIWSSYLLIGQTIASFFFVLYLIIISIGFVHRNHLLWQRSPLTNICWLSTSILLLIMHIGVCIIEIYIYVPEAEITKHFIEIIPFYIWIIGFLWPILLITTNVFTKRHEISMYSRQQRRARLEFGTKLGMNSPF